MLQLSLESDEDLCSAAEDKEHVLQALLPGAVSEEAPGFQLDWNKSPLLELLKVQFLTWTSSGVKAARVKRATALGSYQRSADC